MWPVGCPSLPVVGHQGRVWFGLDGVLGTLNCEFCPFMTVKYVYSKCNHGISLD